MILYTRDGMVQGTVDEILEFISKQNKKSVEWTCSTNAGEINLDNKIEEIDNLSAIKIYHKCEYCGYDKAEVDTSKVLTSYPPKYSYKCPKCDKIGYIFTTEV